MVCVSGRGELDFSHSGTDGDEMLGTCGPPSISIPINLTTTPQPPMCGSLEVLSSRP